jgi:hypothetical protein
VISIAEVSKAAKPCEETVASPTDVESRLRVGWLSSREQGWLVSVGVSACYEAAGVSAELWTVWSM